MRFSNEESRKTLEIQLRILKYVGEGHKQKEAAEKWGVNSGTVAWICTERAPQLIFLCENPELVEAANNLDLNYHCLTRLYKALASDGLDWRTMRPEDISKRKGCGKTCVDIVREAQKVGKARRSS